LEIAFWHSETRNFKRSAALLDSLADFAKNTAVSALFQQLPPVYTVMPRNMLREAMKAVDSLHFDFLYTKKYYPDMVPVQGGKFIMGCDRIIDGDCQSDEILHEQELGSFHIARTETTVWQFAIYCAAEDMDIHDFIEKNWSDPGDNPIVNVEWYDAVEYANWVSKQKGGKEAISKNHAGLAGIYEVDIRSGYRLPTEAEWEYAAKGGNRPDKTLYSGSNTLDSVGWFSGNSERTQPVGEKKANALAIYDMSGNVEEWCWDWYGKYKTDPVKDYKGPPDEGSSRVVRGGSWNRNPGYFRSAADRDYYRPESRSDYLGFRLVFVP
jgi:formylglycine-generating enzyme required for sulfatase activity